MRPLDDAPNTDELLPDLLADTSARTERAEVTDALDAIEGALTNNIRPLTGAAAMTPDPPVARYRLTVTITGNTLDEIEDELVTQTRGGFLMDSNYGNRHEWNATDGRCTRVMEHRNPEMTPERYSEELHAWGDARREERAKS